MSTSAVSESESDTFWGQEGGGDTCEGYGESRGLAASHLGGSSREAAASQGGQVPAAGEGGEAQSQLQVLWRPGPPSGGGAPGSPAAAKPWPP